MSVESLSDNMFVVQCVERVLFCEILVSIFSRVYYGERILKEYLFQMC